MRGNGVLAERALCQHVSMQTNENVALCEQQEALRPESYVRSRVTREHDSIADLQLNRHEVPVIENAPGANGNDGSFFGYFLRSIRYENAAFGLLFSLVRYDDDTIAQGL